MLACSQLLHRLGGFALPKQSCGRQFDSIPSAHVHPSHVNVAYVRCSCASRSMSLRSETEAARLAASGARDCRPARETEVPARLLRAIGRTGRTGAAMVAAARTDPHLPLSGGRQMWGEENDRGQAYRGALPHYSV